MMKLACGKKIEASALSIPAGGSPDLRSSHRGAKERECEGWNEVWNGAG
jgi:hypothetical protein